MDRRAIKFLFILGGFIIILLLVGTVGFSILEHQDIFTAFSTAINILSDVGLGNYPENSRLLVIILEIGAIGIVTMTIATLTDVMTRGALRQYFGRYRMDERINKLNDHFIIAGFSLIGENLVRDLLVEEQPFMVIELDPQKIILLEERNILYIEGDASNEEILKQAGVEKACGLFSVLGNDSDNLMVVLSARGLNPDLKIVSRVTRDEYVRRFMRAGANVALSPQEWASKRMIHSVLRPHLLVLLSSMLDSGIEHAYLDETKVPDDSHLIGKTLGNSGLRSAVDIVVLGIARKIGNIDTSPGADTIIMEGDVLLGYGYRDNFRRLEKFLRESPKPAS